MLERARALDARGEYRLVPDGDLTCLEAKAYDLVLCAFTFDNIPTTKKVELFRGLRRVLRDGGRIVNLVSSPEIYVHEWASFSTKAFSENRSAKSGDTVRIVMLDVEDARPVEDVFCTDHDYREVYKQAGLLVEDTHRPLASSAEPFAWVTETTISPWAIYVLGSAG